MFRFASWARLPVALALAAATTLVASPGWAAAPAGGTAVPGTATLTLITGDQVTLAPGARPRFRAAPGRERIGHHSWTTQGRTYVVPNDALAPLGRDQLDAALFDVTGLVRQGYARRALSVIVTRAFRARSAVGALTSRGWKTRPLPSVGGDAVTVPADRPGALWAELAPGRGGRVRSMATGVGKVWLNRVNRLALDRSVPQVGAPQLWKGGQAGRGVTVAVLDSGIDPRHPDFAGRITGFRDFAEGHQAPMDDHGHGTHVASTVAGSGQASGGKYRGVAPGANLLVGRVCSLEYCTDEHILAGLEWAAPQARVVNLSLGSEAPSDGTDLLSTAVNRLTAEHGTLFVAAANMFLEVPSEHDFHKAAPPRWAHTDRYPF